MKIKVEGVEYAFPDVDSITMDEAIIVERYSGVGLETLLPGEAMPMGAVKAFVVIAIMRARPNDSEKEIAAAIGKIKLTDLGSLVEGDDAGPPELAPSGSEGSAETSGGDSRNGSASSPDAANRPDTGAPLSAMPAISNLGTSAS